MERNIGLTKYLDSCIKQDFINPYYFAVFFFFLTLQTKFELLVWRAVPLQTHK